VHPLIVCNRSPDKICRGQQGRSRENIYNILDLVFIYRPKYIQAPYLKLVDSVNVFGRLRLGLRVKGERVVIHKAYFMVRVRPDDLVYCNSGSAPYTRELFQEFQADGFCLGRQVECSCACFVTQTDGRFEYISRNE
jgi:hypothetical protein